MKATTTLLIAFVTCIFSLQTATAATGDINGLIIEKETNAPVAFAEITLDNGTTKTVITANEYGHYAAQHLATGKYQVTVKYDNHVAETTEIRVKDSYTTGTDLLINTTTNTALTDKDKKEGTTGSLRQQNDRNNYFDMLVNPTQKPAKRPMA